MTYQKQSEWPGGFIADVTIKNTTTTAVDGHRRRRADLLRRGCRPGHVRLAPDAAGPAAGLGVARPGGGALGGSRRPGHRTHPAHARSPPNCVLT
ncbi:cellulose binding domain-containing protein [Micromonospora sp. DH15]|nr:cellulose binding domain-containing protein [Micromonospora sp. DH15]